MRSVKKSSSTTHKSAKSNAAYPARRTASRLLVCLVLAILTVAASEKVAFAHPLGNFTINHYSRLEISTNELRLFYVLDLAEIPTFQERQVIDQNNDGTISTDERARYLASKVQVLLRNLPLQLARRLHGLCCLTPWSYHSHRGKQDYPSCV